MTVTIKGPKTPEEVIEIMEKAYKELKYKRLRKYLGKVKPLFPNSEIAGFSTSIRFSPASIVIFSEEGEFVQVRIKDNRDKWRVRYKKLIEESSHDHWDVLGKKPLAKDPNF